METVRNETLEEFPLSSHRTTASLHVQPRRSSIEMSPVCLRPKQYVLLSCGNASNVTDLPAPAAQGLGQVFDEEMPRVFRWSKA
jgi:hypothetical protein